MHPAAAGLVDAALRGMLVALLALLAALMWRGRPASAARHVAIALLVGLVVQVVASTPLFEASVALRWRGPLIAISIGNGVLFWLLVALLVDDDFELRPWHVAVWLAVFGYVVVVMSVAAPQGWPATRWLFAVQRALPPAFALLTALTAGLNWRADLVERRRRLRLFVIVSGIGYALAMVVARAQSPRGQLSDAAATLDILFLLLIVVVIASRLLRLVDADPLLPMPAAAPRAPADLREAAPATPPAAPPDPAEQRLADALRRAMADEHAYRSEALTVAALAERLAVPEYRLRRLINQRLGFRNFNAYVNGYRLDEARAALADPARRDLPILTIALEAGFGSIGPFNRAFKAATGQTPGEFRRENLADS